MKKTITNSKPIETLATSVLQTEGVKEKMTYIDFKGKPQSYEYESGMNSHGCFVISHPHGKKEILENESIILGNITDAIIEKVDIEVGSHKESFDILKVRIESDNATPIQLSVMMGSYFSAKIVGLLNAADLTKNIIIGAEIVLKGQKYGDIISQGDNVFPKISSGTDANRLQPVWADGLKQLPEPPKKIRSRDFLSNDMSEINAIQWATVAEIREKLSVIKNNQKEGVQQRAPIAEAIAMPVKTAQDRLYESQDFAKRLKEKFENITENNLTIRPKG